MYSRFVHINCMLPYQIIKVNTYFYHVVNFWPSRSGYSALKPLFTLAGIQDVFYHAESIHCFQGRYLFCTKALFAIRKGAIETLCKHRLYSIERSMHNWGG